MKLREKMIKAEKLLKSIEKDIKKQDYKLPQPTTKEREWYKNHIFKIYRQVENTLEWMNYDIKELKDFLVKSTGLTRLTTLKDCIDWLQHLFYIDEKSSELDGIIWYINEVYKYYPE